MCSFECVCDCVSVRVCVCVNMRASNNRERCSSSLSHTRARACERSPLFCTLLCANAELPQRIWQAPSSCALVWSFPVFEVANPSLPPLSRIHTHRRSARLRVRPHDYHYTGRDGHPNKLCRQKIMDKDALHVADEPGDSPRVSDPPRCRSH
jgi:hypothetical protein